MNKPTFRALDAVHTRLTQLIDADNTNALGINLAGLRQMAESARDDWEQNSDAWQEGERGEAENERIQALEDACDQIEEAISTLTDARDRLTPVIEDAPEGSFN